MDTPNDRNALFFDAAEWPIELLAFQRWRKRVWSMVDGERLLEVGVGTGKNIPYYPKGAAVTAVDLSPRMLARARRRARRLRREVDLREMDVQELAFSDESFDAAVSTFVFCTVPDPVLGLREVYRVLKAGAELYLLEHVLSERPVLRTLMELANPVAVHLLGENINRRTQRNLELAGFETRLASPVLFDVFWIFVGRKAV